MKPFGIDAADTLTVLEALLAALGGLLDGSELTRTVVVEAAGRTLRPAMTLGLVLEAEAALAAAALSPEQQARLAHLRARRLAERDFRAAAYQARLRREMKSLEDRGRWAREDRRRQAEGDPQEEAAEGARRERLRLLAVELGVPGIEHARQAEKLAFAQLARVPRLDLLQRRLDDDAPLAPSPLL